MEIFLATAIAGAGYAISNQLQPPVQENTSKVEKEQEEQQSTAHTIYNVQPSQASQQQEAALVEQAVENAVMQPTKVNSVLTGQSIDLNEFKHNNMVPFFGGSVKQNMKEGANQQLLELFTGTPSNNIQKEELAPMFAPTKQDRCILQYGTEDIKQRFVQSQKKHNVHPSVPIQVGPGLDNGYTNQPSGGFHQANTRDYIMPRSVDELRTKTNPKLSFKGRIITGKSRHNKRQVVGQVSTHKTPTSFEWGPERYFKSIGSVKKPKMAENIILPDTNRKTSKQYIGPQAPATMRKSKTRGKYRVANKQVFTTSGARNVNLENQNSSHDYGRSGLSIPENKRSTTGERTYLGNTTSIVKAIVAPIQDMFRKTKRQDTIYNVRTTGNVGQHALKGTVYDPEDVARTTIKETNIHNSRTGNLVGGRNVGTVYDPDNIARVTLKETSIHNTRTGNMAAISKTIVYDPDQRARTTMKETMIENSHEGHIQMAGSKGFVYDPEDVARTTMKEMNIHNTHNGQMQRGPSKGIVYDPEDVARTTIKETNIHDTRTGNMGAQTSEKGVVYADTARQTLRNTLDAPETVLNMTTNSNKVPVYDPNDTFRPTLRQSTEKNYRDGNLGGERKSFVYDPDDIARKTVKQTTVGKTRIGNVNLSNLDNAAYDCIDVQAPETNRQSTTREYTGGAMNTDTSGSGYQNATIVLTNTNRQSLSKEYTGAPESSTSRPQTYDAAYNMNVNELKEKTLEGRAPAHQRTSTMSGAEMINMQVYKKNLLEKQGNRTSAYDKIVNVPHSVETTGIVTQNRHTYNESKLNNRIDPSILDTFKHNPFTKSLNSYV